MTLTQAPEGWQATRQRVRRLTMRLNAEGYTCQWAWTVERGSNTGMKHVHLLQHGDYIPQRLLQDRWGHRVDIRKIRSAKIAANYASKEAMLVVGYSMKGTQQALLHHLDLNGGRAHHMSRNYLRGHRTRDVERMLWPMQEKLTWMLVPCTESDAEVRARCAAMSTIPTGMVD